MRERWSETSKYQVHVIVLLERSGKFAIAQGVQVEGRKFGFFHVIQQGGHVVSLNHKQIIHIHGDT